MLESQCCQVGTRQALENDTMETKRGSRCCRRRQGKVKLTLRASPSVKERTLHTIHPRPQNCEATPTTRGCDGSRAPKCAASRQDSLRQETAKVRQLLVRWFASAVSPQKAGKPPAYPPLSNQSTRRPTVGWRGRLWGPS